MTNATSPQTTWVVWVEEPWASPRGLTLGPLALASALTRAGSLARHPLGTACRCRCRCRCCCWWWCCCRVRPHLVLLIADHVVLEEGCPFSNVLRGPWHLAAADLSPESLLHGHLGCCSGPKPQAASASPINTVRLLLCTCFEAHAMPPCVSLSGLVRWFIPLAVVPPIFYGCGNVARHDDTFVSVWSYVLCVVSGGWVLQCVAGAVQCLDFLFRL